MLLPLALAVSCMVLAGQQPWFTDVTEGSGIPAIRYGEGVNFRDLDGDGLPELFLPDVKGADRLFKNLGNCRFEDITDRSGINEKDGIGAVFGDINGDGLDDLYVVRGAYPYGLNVLYVQGKDGKFTDATVQAGTAGRKNGISAVTGDVDGDGKPDIFVTNWGVNTLYHNESSGGNIKFVDITEKAGLASEGRSWGALMCDFNGDGKPDIFVMRGGAGKPEEQKLYINRGDGTFEDRRNSGITGVGWSMGAVSADFDGDGSPDLFVCNYDGPDHLYLNDGTGHFRDVTDTSGITSGHSVGAAAGDIDGDFLPDLVVAGFTGPVKVFRNLGGGKFEEVKDSGVGPYKKNEGVALADVNGDGGLDLYVANYDGHNRLYRNNLGGACIRIRSSAGKALPEGTVARLYKAGGLGDKKSLLASQELRSSFGFCSQSPAELFFRLPDKSAYDLRVIFPGAIAVDMKNIKAGIYNISPDARRD